MQNNRLALLLGIRPDVIRASRIIKLLRSRPEVDLRFIWSGQHYSDNLKDIFFRELSVPPPDVELGARGETDAEIVSSVISKTYAALEEINPAAAIFLGDTNTVVGCLAAAQLNIPIVHIEGCMRSYDWRMPEEKYRSTIDHLSDVIYAYFDEYKEQGIAEGLNPSNIVVTGNLIVDIIQDAYFQRQNEYKAMASASFFQQRGLMQNDYYVMTCHRRENVENPESLRSIFTLISRAPRTVYFLASYRTQKAIARLSLPIPANVRLVDPIGYKELLCLMVNSCGVITDSGTVVEETCVLQVPSIQMRKSTERPQVYDAKSSVKFDPAEPQSYPADEIFRKLESLRGAGWDHQLGDGQASERVVADLIQRLHTDGFRRHLPSCYHLKIARSYQGDGLRA